MIELEKYVDIEDILDNATNVAEILDERDLVAHDQAINTGYINSGVERGLDSHQKSKQKKRDRDGTDSEDRAGFLAKQISEDEGEVLHETAASADASTRTPLSRWSVMSARSAASGS